MLLVEVSQNATGDDSAPGPPPAGGIELLERLIICSIWICALRQQPRDETRKFLRCRFHAPDSLADFSFLNYQDPNCVPCAIRAGAPGGKVEILDDLRGRPASAIATQFLPARYRRPRQAPPCLRLRSEPSPYSAASNFPTSAVRSAMRFTNRLSFAACAPSPTAPKPSSVGIPSAAVKFPSEPPPVSDSSNSTPISRPNSRAFRKSATIPAERSIGGRFNPPVTSIVQRRSKGFSPRIFFSSPGASRRRSTRMSTSTRASAATTLLRVPPEITPGFTVMPRCN